MDSNAEVKCDCGVLCEGKTPAEAWFKFVHMISCNGAKVDNIKVMMEAVDDEKILFILDSVVAVLEKRMDYEAFAKATGDFETTLQGLFKVWDKEAP